MKFTVEHWAGRWWDHEIEHWQLHTGRVVDTFEAEHPAAARARIAADNPQAEYIHAVAGDRDFVAAWIAGAVTATVAAADDEGNTPMWTEGGAR